MMTSAELICRTREDMSRSGARRENSPGAAVQSIEVLTRTRGLEGTRDVLRRRRDRAFDPQIVDAFLDDGARMVADIEARDVWSEVLRCFSTE